MIDLVVQRIRTAPDNPFQEIGTSLDLAAIVKAPPARDKVAFVWPVAASGAPNQLVNAHRQRIAESVGVTIFLRRHGDQRGAEKADQLVTIYTWLRKALIGAQIDPAYEPLEFQMAGLDLMKDGYVFWTEQFTTAHIHRV